ncbi:hypothetical protein PAXRUDRAFT_830638 [Paxillus rubicundulus Ve08.2h10]|uniref:F-box domain-containing protein n=1 Tax=Paxillus rubicundulus Ve08.2h10 TaxID=930991 RepID=A0A0D0E3K7_9AGAM|nr:hypothetical protein PAXRUDRAFT_830638 [Paxillus rubicundulus Ve08.2h10]
MPRASKRIKTSATEDVAAQPSASISDAHNLPPSTQPQLVLAFKTGPTLEHIPDDVLLEILSHLPTIDIGHVLWCHCRQPPMMPSEALTRTSTVRALSKTSKLLRVRCLAMAWRRIETCTAGPNHTVTFFRVVGEAMKANMKVLKDCPHLRPLIQTATVALTRYKAATIVSALAEGLASLPNVTVIEVVHAHSHMTTAIKDGFEGKRFPSVRKLILPSHAHEILRCCPNVEEVICNEYDGSTLVGAIVKGNCKQVRVLKGVSASLKRLVKLLPNLNHVSVSSNSKHISSLASFPFLATIDIDVSRQPIKKDVPLVEYAAEAIATAKKVLQENQSQEKSLRVTRWVNTGGYNESLLMEIIRV